MYAYMCMMCMHFPQKPEKGVGYLEHATYQRMNYIHPLSMLEFFS